MLLLAFLLVERLNSSDKLPVLQLDIRSFPNSRETNAMMHVVTLVYIVPYLHEIVGWLRDYSTERVIVYICMHAATIV